MANLTPVEQAKLKKIMADPVLWAQAFIVSNNPTTKKYGPWIARDYQIEMMRDKSLRKVYRCGRRLGKTDTMVIEGLHKVFTHKNYRVLYITPYENQVNLIFMRMRELIHDSPLIKNEIVKMKNSPYTIQFRNGSVIMGFTTGASSGSGAASVRGQRADWLMLDELDYMGAEDYATVSMIANERADIGITASSTPTGKRGTFYQMCTDQKMGFTEHYHDSFANPNYTKEIDDQNKITLTCGQYEHEILAVFGTEESGVFDKDKVDAAMKREYYTYEPLTDSQMRNLEGGLYPAEYIYDENNPAPRNVFRCMGVNNFNNNKIAC